MKLSTSLPALTATAAALNISTIHHFPTGTWLENIAQTQNGSLLVTLIGKAEVHIINNPGTASLNATPSLLASIPGHNAVLGITEMQPNVFAVAVGNVTESNSPVEGTFGVYSLDFTAAAARECERTTAADTKSDTGAVKIEKIADLSEVGLINGIAFDPPSTLYLADSWLGNIVALNASSGETVRTIEHPTLQANFSSPGLVLGVNGVRVHGDYLYFSNTVQNLLGRIDLNSINDAADGDVQVEIIKEGEEISQPDDFAVLEDGSVLIVRPLADTLQHVELDGSVEEIARGGEVSGGTSVIRGKRGEFYVSTSPLVGGVPKEGGRVVKIEI